jgi:hypothetical protein
MNKIFILICFALISCNIFAGNNVLIQVNQLPEKAQTFISTHFSGVNVSYAKVDRDVFEKSYEVILVDGCKMEFDRNGEWTEINCKFKEVPLNAIPAEILKQINARYPDTKILQIEKDYRDYEVKISNGLELKFDKKFNLIDIDD